MQFKQATVSKNDVLFKYVFGYKQSKRILIVLNVIFRKEKRRSVRPFSLPANQLFNIIPSLILLYIGAILVKEKKGSNQDKIRNVLNMFSKRGIVNVGMIMIGFDYETEQDILRYVEQLPKYNIHQLRISIATPFPGTAFEKRLKEKGINFDPDLSKWDTGHLVYEHPTISPSKMLDLLRQIVNSFYSSKEWNKRMKDFVSEHPRMKKSVEEFRNYVYENMA